MGLFDYFKKKREVLDEPKRLENFPEMLNAKLLFFEKPILKTDKILAELKLYFAEVENPTSEKALLYFFPDIKIELEDATIPAQCSIFIPDDESPEAEVSKEAFQQNWHWPSANETAKKCKYEILVSDFVTRPLDYKTRLYLFMIFLVAVSKATNPQVVYSINSQKLIESDSLIKSWDGQKKEILFGITNVRLFNIANDNTNSILMDTVGMSFLGLPDFQLRFAALNESKVAELLWNYAYYIYERGDIIESGNTLLGLDPNSNEMRKANFISRA